MGQEEADIDYLVELPFYDGWSVKVLTDGTMVNRWQKLLDRWEADGPKFNVTEGDKRIMRLRAARAQQWIDDHKVESGE